MLKTYLKIAWRTIVKSRFYSTVNIIGLATGLAFTLLIGAYAWSEWKVNHSLRNADNQYILQSQWKEPGMGFPLSTLGYLPRALREQYPNLVANYYRWDGVTSAVSKEDKHFREGLQIGDSTLLGMYGFTLLHGNAGTALNDPFSLVITEEKAIKYFGKTDVVGQTLAIDNFSGSRHDFMITGVLKQPALNSVTMLNDNNFNQFFLSAAAVSFFGRTIDAWQNPNIVGLVELRKDVTAKDLEEPIQQLMKKNAPAYFVTNMQQVLTPLKKYYLEANNGIVKKNIYTLTLVAVFILLMAVINFINMAVSRSSARMKEIGLRKVLGGLKKQLVAQFLVESVLLVELAVLIALLLYIFLRPFFGQMIGKEIPGLLNFPPALLAAPFILALLVGFVAGIYPAFVLSSLKSVDSLKGKLKTVQENIWLRKSLVAFQFGTAAVVFIGAIIISQQVRYFFDKDLGYNKEYILYSQLPRDWSQKGVQHMEAIREQLAAMPEVSNVALSFEIPNGMNSGSLQLYKAGGDSTQAITSQQLTTDNQYAATYSIPMKAGSFFTPVYTPADSTKIVINESQSIALGWRNPQEAIGKQVRILGYQPMLTISGVTADFNFDSMQNSIRPITFINVHVNTIYRFFSVKLRPGNIGKSIGAVQKQWAALMPGAPFEYNFMDDALKQLYKKELQLQKAAYTATALAFIIVLLGVLGLVSLSIQKRTKEIGIRKVIGAPVSGIIGLFIKEFVPVIGLAGLVACLPAWWLMRTWLNGYAYRIPLSVLPFVIAIALLGIVTTLLITAQTIKAAWTNPVKSLRAE